MDLGHEETGGHQEPARFLVMTLAHHRAVLRAGSRKLKPITEQTNNGGAATKRLENVVGA